MNQTKNGLGFSLLELMASIGIGGLLSIIILHLSSSQSKLFSQSDATLDISLFIKTYSRHFASPSNCLATLSGLIPTSSGTTIPVIKQDGGATIFTPSTSHNAASYFGKVSVESIALKSSSALVPRTPQTVNIAVKFYYAVNGQAQSYQRSFPISVILNESSQVINCQDDASLYARDICSQAGATMNLAYTSCSGPKLNPPSGTIASFNQSNCPPGWIIANGSGSPPTTPNLHGRYIRGRNTTSFTPLTNRDPQGDRPIGNLQSYSIGQHTHAVNAYRNNCGFHDDDDPDGSNNGNVCRRDSIINNYSPAVNFNTNSTNESIPVSIILLFCMKQ
ncbi:MAG: prepilin-type N-terminal cleavage/methylation domain-containing protein [Oligoflexia bacterium]|nr:prepilin-type N-terminal cleavage/methylation domain-containing protein [Oligoflexia bacterium]